MKERSEERVRERECVCCKITHPHRVIAACCVHKWSEFTEERERERERERGERKHGQRMYFRGIRKESF